MKRKRVVDLESGEAYTYDKVRGFELFDPYEFKYKGFDIKSLYEHYTDKKNINKKNEEYFEILKEHLISSGYKPKAITLYNLIEELIDNVLIIDNEKKYNLFKFDEVGYIIGFDNIKGNQIGVDIKSFPSDLTEGYYRIESGKIIKDKEREEVLWNFG